MNVARILMLNRGLLSGTAVLGLLSMMAGGGVFTGIGNFTAGMVGNNLGALIDKLRRSGDVLRNQDLAKAAGRAVGLTLEDVSRDFPEIGKPLKTLAEKTEDYWLLWEQEAKTLNLFESLQEEQLVHLFSQQGDEFRQYQVLSEEEWREVVTWLFEQGKQKGVLAAPLEDYEDVMKALTRRLVENFNKNLREVLKDDAAKGGEAFAGMLLDLHGKTLAQIGEIQENLRHIATREEICHLLQQLDTGLQDELRQIRETLQQYFDQTKPRLPIPQECETVIEDRTQDFVGRRYVFEAIKTFLQQNPKGYFILEADPGVGKSAILAKLVQLLKYRCLTHFNIQSQGIIRADQFLENICTQLIAGYSLNYDGLPERATTDGNILARLLAGASKTLPPGQKIIIVVDALDEVDLSSQTPGSNILYLPDALPQNVYFILSKRPKALPLPLCDKQTLFDLMAYPAESALDARFYAQKRLENSPQIREWVTAKASTPEAFLKELVEKSENNFMYLRYVLNDIHKGLYHSETLDDLPKGLERYYQKHWQIMGMNEESSLSDKIRTIYVLSQVREAVSRRLLVQLTQVKESRLRRFLRDWEQFLRLQQVERETRYTLYHASFSDFLKEQAEDSGVDLEEINHRIADNLAEGAPL
ncbi:hypothetical protein PN462_18080 [Spirulina sp. CS-785/01]|uniref:hypothetical protein n=1 Tax=Spirulina sp. CS-785/01 TaxID=3021716 RepID=UPI00232F1CBA|nr:hypothetical protein [Spirulina sp. CS-785/01]MDB9315028.1 hypothetical protein [Spirulina sp. CS-785/01]